MSSNASKPQQPIARVRYGAITAAIWEQQTSDGARTFYNFTIQRSYQDEEGNWHNTETFRPADSMALVSCVQDAFRWISIEGKRRAKGQNQPEDATHQTVDSAMMATDDVPF